jgi:hypothetical protein
LATSRDARRGTPTRPPTGRPWARLTAGLVAAALLAGCGAGTGEPAAPAPRAASGDPRALAGVCPATIVIQSNWYPTADVAAAYALLGPGYHIDANRKRVSGPLVAGGVDTGVTLEIRSGGPAIGFQQVPAQMYLDPAITLGFVITDESIQYSTAQPTTAVVAPLDGDPQILLWDPTVHPQWNTITDIGSTDVPVLAYNGASYMEYLVGTGILRRRQVDGSYDGTPARFVASGGRIAVQGYATNEPYLYEHEVRAWGRPVRYALVSETNYPQYANTLAIRSGDRQRLDPCLRRLVPMVQRAEAEFLTAPDRVLGLIVDVVAAFHSSFSYSRGNAEFAARQLRGLGLAGNCDIGILGDLSDARLQRMIDILRPILAAEHKPVRPGLSPADLATNDYIDPTIGLH